MSGPRPRIPIWSMTKELRDDLCCRDCDLSPGWGWKAKHKLKGWDLDDNRLPSPGNGWEADGLCESCHGKGIAPVPFTEMTK